MRSSDGAYGMIAIVIMTNSNKLKFVCDDWGSSSGSSCMYRIKYEILTLFCTLKHESHSAREWQVCFDHCVAIIFIIYTYQQLLMVRTAATPCSGTLSIIYNTHHSLGQLGSTKTTPELMWDQLEIVVSLKKSWKNNFLTQIWHFLAIYVINKWQIMLSQKKIQSAYN